MTAHGHLTREALWRSTWDALHAGPVTVLEFGVATGEATRTWVDGIANPQLRWHGFDTFDGLPVPWIRGGVVVSPAGTFTNGGTPPDIDDGRVEWHAGLIEDTLVDFDPDLRPGSVVALFDLDLYEPSKVALDWLTPRLEPGDLVYFDEVFDPGERRLVDEWLQDVKVEMTGWTGMALMLRVEGHQ